MTQDEIFSEIKEVCLRKAHQLYGDQFPYEVQSRLDEELSYFQTEGNEGAFQQLYIAYKLKYFSEICKVSILGGWYAEYSFLYYLLGLTLPNPLPMHYVCTCCGQFERKQQEVKSNTVFSFEKELAKCFNCNAVRIPQGENLSFEIYKEYQKHTPLSGFECLVPMEYLIDAFNFINGILRNPSNRDLKLKPVKNSFFKQNNDSRDGVRFNHLVSLRPNAYIDYLQNLRRKTNVRWERIPLDDKAAWQRIPYSFTELLNPRSKVQALVKTVKIETVATVLENIEVPVYIYDGYTVTVSNESKQLLESNSGDCFTREEFLNYLKPWSEEPLITEILTEVINGEDDRYKSQESIFKSKSLERVLLEKGMASGMINYIKQVGYMPLKGQVYTSIVLYYMLLWYYVNFQEAFRQSVDTLKIALPGCSI